MSIEPGARVGHCQAVPRLGAGGMDGVRRACDPKRESGVAVRLPLEELA